MQSAPSTGQNSTSSRTASCEAEPLGDWSIVAHRFKTRMCRTWETSGACLYTSRCMFAHGPQDLRTAEQNLDAGLVTAAAVRAFQHRQAKQQQQQQSRQQESSQQPQRHGADMARSKRPKRTDRGPNGRPPHHRAETSHYDATSSAMAHDKAVPPQAPPQPPLRAAPATTPPAAKNQIAPIAHMPRTTLQTLPMGHFSDLPAPRVSDSPPRPSLIDHGSAQVLHRGDEQHQQHQQHHHDVSIGAAQACPAPLVRAQGNEPRDFHHGGPQQGRVYSRHQQDALYQEVQVVQPVQPRHAPQVRQPPPQGYQPSTQPMHDVVDHQPQPQSVYSPPQQRRYPAAVYPTDNRCSGRGDHWPSAAPIVTPTNASLAFDHGQVQAAPYGPAQAQGHEQVYGMHGQVGGPVKEAPPPPLHCHRPYDHNHHAACRCTGCIDDANATGRVPVEVAVMLPPPPPAWQ